MTKIQKIDWAWDEIRRALIDISIEPDTSYADSTVDEKRIEEESWSEAENAVREILNEAISDDAT